VKVTPLNVVVEGTSDQGIVLAIARECGFEIGNFFGGKGKDDILRKLASFNQAARHAPWFVLVDLDTQPCPASAAKRWLPEPSEKMCFRVAVAEAEAWLLADVDSFSAFLGVSSSLIPPNPENLPDPKQTVMTLAAKSRYRNIREGLAPRQNSGARVGPTYAADIREYARTKWRPGIAADNAPSLARCMKRVRELMTA
jgi:hypothetical protein